MSAKLYVLEMHLLKKKSALRISQELEMSSSTVYRILNEFSSPEIFKRPLGGFIQRNLISNPAIQSHIKSFAEGVRPPFSSTDLQKSIAKRFKVLLPKHQIQRHLKQRLNKSYKKG